MAGAAVSDDVIVEILTKLPVKSLLRFQSVCKIWYSVISNPQLSSNLHQMQPCVLICENLRDFSTITVESLLKIKDRVSTRLFLPWEIDPDSKILFLGSCNGLVCVDYISKSSPDRSGLILWNPSTRKFRKLPRPGCYSSTLRTYAWIGYDELIDDYKLVWLNYNVGELDVFTLKSNSWRRRPIDHPVRLLRTKLPDTEDRYNPKSSGVLSNGVIHWLTSYYLPSCDIEVCILAMDLATEAIRLLNFSQAKLELTTWVGSIGGCLCLCSTSFEEDDVVRDLWMMKEYGVESSWTKVLSISVFFHSHDFGFLMIYPILFSEEGKEMVAMCIGLESCHPGRIVKLRVEGSKKVVFEEKLWCVARDLSQYNVILHMESLVSL